MLFVSFEGIDGCGKSTQLQRCTEALKQQGYNVLATRNPGGTSLGVDIRAMLLHSPQPVTPLCELLLYMADRAQHTDEVIKPALAQGQIVLCDRHVDSTLAYQGYGRGLSLQAIDELNTMATGGLLPQLTFLFDGPPEYMLERMHARAERMHARAQDKPGTHLDRLEREQQDFHDRVREGFLSLARRFPQRIIVLDALQPIDVLHQQVLAQVLAAIKLN